MIRQEGQFVLPLLSLGAITMSDSKPIADIVVGERHRKDMGDLAALADSIREVGLLHPIGITNAGELIFGERRLHACQSLGWTEIAVTVVNIASIADGEYHENEMRKDFTVSERVAILETIERRKHGGDRKSPYRNQVEDLPLDRLSREQAVKRAGLGNTTTARQAARIVHEGIPALVEAVDRGDIAIEPGFAIVRQSPERQAEIVKMSIEARRAAIRGLDRPGKNTGPKKPRTKQQQAPVPKHIDHLRDPVWPTKEELGYPPDGSSVAEYDAFFAKYGRTPTRPKTVRDMLDANELTSGLVEAVSIMVCEQYPDADQFDDYISQMLAYVPQPEKTNGLQTDFAAKARTTLRRLEKALPKALALLIALDARLKERNVDRGRNIAAIADYQVH